MKLDKYRDHLRTAHDKGWEFDLERLRDAVERSREEPDTFRNMSMLGWYGSTLTFGSSVLAEVFDLAAAPFEAQCLADPAVLSFGEIILAGHANLFSCSGQRDLVFSFRERLTKRRTDRNQTPKWHHARALAGIALGERSIYRDSTGVDACQDEPLPFTPGELHGYNPQSLLAHLAGAVENHATIIDVWPAFEECVFNFPSKEETGDFDGACLFWIARIVHHHIGGQPLGRTADWLSRHFNAWADGHSLSPIQ